MANTHQYQMKRTSVSGRLPNTADPANTSYIPAGGLAVNFADQFVFVSNGSSLIQVGSHVSTLTTNSISFNDGSNAVVNSSLYTGTANNAVYLGGNLPNTYVSNAYLLSLNYVSNTQLTANLANYYLANNPAGYVNASAISTGTANNTNNFGGQAPSYYVSNTYLVSLNYVSNAQLASNLANYITNTAAYGVFAQNTAIYAYAASNAYVTNTYQTMSGLSANVLTLTANNSNYFGTQAPSYYVSNTYMQSLNYVSNAQLASNLSNYITNTSAYSTFAQNNSVYSTFAQNTAIYAYAAGNTSVYSTFAQNTSVYSVFAQNTSIYAYAASNTYVNNTFAQNTAIYAYAASNTNVYNTFAQNTAIYSYASNATNITTGTLSAARLPYTLNQNVGSSDSPNFVNLELSGNLSVGGSITTISANNLAITDNMLYLNNGVLANVTSLSANGSAIVFVANNNFAPTWSVTTLSITPASYNNTYTITAANSTTFTVASTVTGAFVSGGTARGKSSANPDIGFAAGYNDGTYHHTGFFRDHATGVWKVFDGYLPEPDNSVYIDQTNSSFNVANFMAGTLYAGNNSVSATVNSTFYSATANNANNLGGQAPSYYVSNTYMLGLNYVSNTQLASNLSNYITNTSAYSTFAQNTSVYNTFAQNTAIYAYAASNTYVNSTFAQNTAIYAYAASNTAVYSTFQTMVGLSANVAKLTANNTVYLNGQLSSYYTNATNITTGNLPYAQLPANVVVWSNTNTFTANQTFSANVNVVNVYSTGTVNASSYSVGTSFVANTTQVTISGIPLSANGSTGSAGRVLTSNGATGAPYWATVSSNSSNVTSVSSNYSVLTTDDFIIANGTINIQLGAASVGGKKYNIQNGGAGQVTVLPNGSDTINGKANVVLMFKNSLIGVMPSNSSNWLIF
jgi:hypothetical protein